MGKDETRREGRKRDWTKEEENGLERGREEKEGGKMKRRRKKRRKK